MIQQSLSGREKLLLWIVSATMMILAFTTIYPIAFTFTTSLKSTREFIRQGFALPLSPTFDKYVTAWTTIKLDSYFINSTIVTIIGVGLVVTVSQNCCRRSIRRSGGLPAMIAALTEPIELPATQLGRGTPLSCRAA